MLNREVADLRNEVDRTKRAIVRMKGIKNLEDLYFWQMMNDHDVLSFDDCCERYRNEREVEKNRLIS